MKYRKKPVVIEATQWFKDGDHPAVYPSGFSKYYYIETLEGAHDVRAGDWIITGVKGEHYPCKPDIFELTYERNFGPSAAADCIYSDLLELLDTPPQPANWPRSAQCD